MPRDRPTLTPAHAVRARTESEFGAERSIEVRQVTKAAFEGDVEDPIPSGHEPKGRLAQAGTQDVLMWCGARETFEGAQEMIGAQTGITGHSMECPLRLRRPVERSDDASHACFRVHGRTI